MSIPGASLEERLVSVVIPIFNRETLIESALNSVLSQSHRPIEVLVIDDGSTDDTVSVVDQWKKKHCSDQLSLTLIVGEHQGANSARNKGIASATGAYIAFLDSDDTWLPQKLRSQLEVLISDQALGGVYCGLGQVDLDSGETTPPEPRQYPRGHILRQMLIHDVTEPTSCWMVKRSCFEQVGVFDVSLPARQDWDMWIRLCARFPVGCVEGMLVEMGNHSGDRVRSKGEREIAAHKTIFRKYAGLRKSQPFWVSLAARSAMYRRRGRVYFHRGISTPKAIGMQLAAIAVWPFAFDSYAALAGIMLPSGSRRKMRNVWNRVLGKTALGIKTH